MAPSVEAGNNLHLIEADQRTGFAIYRTGKPDKGDMIELCALGVEEIMVLSGNAEDHEYRFSDSCPNLKVIYNEEQDSSVPVNAEFLNFFDEWVSYAKEEGKKIAIRCNCGCHRTGRLAAYYQMKHQNATLEDATAIFFEYGKWMWYPPLNRIKHQITAYYDFIHGYPCSTEEKYCVQV